MVLAAEGLTLAPVALVCQDGSTRTMLQPWIDRWQEPHPEETRTAAVAAVADPVEELKRDLLSAVGELMVVGLRRRDERMVRDWTEMKQRLEAMGMQRMTAVVGRVQAGLLQKSAAARWDWRPTAEELLELAALARLAEDLHR
jgi:hypothetical protein